MHTSKCIFLMQVSTLIFLLYLEIELDSSELRQSYCCENQSNRYFAETLSLFMYIAFFWVHSMYSERKDVKSISSQKHQLRLTQRLFFNQYLSHNISSVFIIRDVTVSFLKYTHMSSHYFWLAKSYKYNIQVDLSDNYLKIGCEQNVKMI